MSDGIAGRILPDPKGGKPLFQVMRGYHRYGGDEMAGVRPCEHSRYILDPDWMTVTCGECKQKVEPFAVLMKYSEWWSEMESRRQNIEAATHRLNIAHIRAWGRSAFLTADEKSEAATWLKANVWAWSPALQVEAQELSARLDKLVRERRIKRAEARYKASQRAASPGGPPA